MDVKYLALLPSEPVMMGGCSRCGYMKDNANLYRVANSGPLVCRGCATDDELHLRELVIEACRSAGALGYYEAAERNVDHAAIARTRAELWDLQKQISALNGADLATLPAWMQPSIKRGQP